jgi:hypothetical protein
VKITHLYLSVSTKTGKIFTEQRVLFEDLHSGVNDTIYTRHFELVFSSEVLPIRGYSLATKEGSGTFFGLTTSTKYYFEYGYGNANRYVYAKDIGIVSCSLQTGYRYMEQNLIGYINQNGKFGNTSLIE